MVGDEDQSIYGFRAAYPQALMDFEKTYPDAQILLMEQNYRSTEPILEAANRFVARNRYRRPKTIEPTQGPGAPLQIVTLLGSVVFLASVVLGLHSLCVGADAPFFNGHTNISDDRFLVFGVGGVLTAAKSLRNALLFNVLAYMSDRLLTAGNTVAALDELYLWLSNPIAIEYIRNCLKRVRKRDSALMLASQNLEDFDQEQVREMTKPLFSIPPHQFLFNPGSIGRRFYMDMLQLDEAEFELIQHARRGECLFKCGMERYHLEVKAPPHKATLFGTKGGK